MKPILYLVRAFPGVDVARLAEDYDVRGGAATPATRSSLLAAARDASALAVTYLDRVDVALLEAMPALRHVASYGVGTDHIDLAACRARGLRVTNTPGVLTEATAELAFALLLATARRVTEGDRVVRAGGWTGLDPAFLLGTELFGKTVGIVGFGRIGQAFARRALGAGLRVQYASPREVPFAGATRVELDALFATSDVISLHCPLTPATRDLVSSARIASMKRGAILVNTARGAVVDDAALADALASGQVAAAGLDVFRDEPRVPAAYLALPNVVLTPHLGSGTRETRTAMGRLVTEELVRAARGERAVHPVG